MLPEKTIKKDRVYFTTPVPDTSDMSATRTTRVEHKCNTNYTSATQVRHERHKCYTSTKRTTRVCMSAKRTTRVLQGWKILILITTRVKTYFQTPILAIWQIKDHKERDNFILTTIFWKCLTPMPKWIQRVRPKNWPLKWQKLYQTVTH